MALFREEKAVLMLCCRVFGVQTKILGLLVADPFCPGRWRSFLNRPPIASTYKNTHEASPPNFVDDCFTFSCKLRDENLPKYLLTLVWTRINIKMEVEFV